MPVFISYSREDSDFVDKIAKNLVDRRHHIWLDRWELSVGDSLTDKIQGALTESSAILVILSKKSVASEWCKKELSAGMIRELSEKRVVVLPCVIDDCEIPLFLRDKLYADFRVSPDKALSQIDDALLKITNPQQGRLESPNFHTDWSYSWAQEAHTGRFRFQWYFVDHGEKIDYCTFTKCELICNEAASQIFLSLDDDAEQVYIHRAFSAVVKAVLDKEMRIILSDANPQIERFKVAGVGAEAWYVEIESRRMGNDTGFDTLIQLDKILEKALAHSRSRLRPAA